MTMATEARALKIIWIFIPGLFENGIKCTLDHDYAMAGIALFATPNNVWPGQTTIGLL